MLAKPAYMQPCVRQEHKEPQGKPELPYIGSQLTQRRSRSKPSALSTGKLVPSMHLHSVGSAWDCHIFPSPCACDIGDGGEHSPLAAKELEDLVNQARDGASRGVPGLVNVAQHADLHKDMAARGGQGRHPLTPK